MMNNTIKRILSLTIGVIMISCCVGCASNNQSESTKKKSSKKKSSKTKTTRIEQDDEAETVPQKEETTASVEQTTTTEETTIETEPQTYFNNDYYDVIEEYSYVDKRWDHTFVIHKVMGKKDARVDVSMIAYASNGDVVGKWDSAYQGGFYILAGETSYFWYLYDSQSADEEYSFSSTAHDLKAGEYSKDAVKMTKWNMSGDYLYITLEQTEEIDSYSKGTIYFLKDGKVVAIESDEYFSVMASGLVGIGSTDVMQIWITFDQDFDEVEFVYVP